MMKISNALGIELPAYIEGYGEVLPYQGPYERQPVYQAIKRDNRLRLPGDVKLLGSIREAILQTGLKDGMTISFHHHFRNGDEIINKVVAEIADLGIKDLTLFASSLTLAHAPLIEHIHNKVITGIHTSGLRGELAQEQSLHNILGKPVVFRSHGGRARAIATGEMPIDVAFIGAPACDPLGNMNGYQGQSAFGSMGYAMIDAQYAHKVVAITDNLVPFPLANASIPMTLVDYVVEVESIGDQSKIATGATRITGNPTELLIAKKAAEAIIASGLVVDGYSFQAGSGGASLAVCQYLKNYMTDHHIVGSFAAGGITSYLVELLEQGYFKALLDVQTFDGNAVDSFKRNPSHIEMSAGMYADPWNKSCVVNQLDIMVLSATEIDVNFNVNSVTGSFGMIRGAVGGAPDTAAGAKLTVVVAPTMRKRIPIIRDRVTNVVTPGTTIDLLVTERGIAVNPRRQDLQAMLELAGVETMDIVELKQNIEQLTGVPNPIVFAEEIVGVIEYRDGTVIDVIRKIK